MKYIVKVDGWYVKVVGGKMVLTNDLKQAYTTTSEASAEYVAGRFMATHSELTAFVDEVRDEAK